MASSFEPLHQHLFIPTSIPPTEWDGRCSCIPGFDRVSRLLKDRERTKVTAFYHVDAPPNSYLLASTGLFASDSNLSLSLLESVPEGEVPWEAAGVVRSDCSADAFIFVCSHRQRDERCGYCGPVLVDLINGKLVESCKHRPVNVRAFPCSHIGGHTYAGNVLVYTKHRGVCFGCVAPPLIDVLVDGVCADGLETIPKPLLPHIRGEMSL
jgi:hypothetical protein